MWNMVEMMHMTLYTHPFFLSCRFWIIVKYRFRWSSCVLSCIHCHGSTLEEKQWAQTTGLCSKTHWLPTSVSSARQIGFYRLTCINREETKHRQNVLFSICSEQQSCQHHLILIHHLHLVKHLIHLLQEINIMHHHHPNNNNHIINQRK